jgi:hypothetical protein
MHPVIIEAVAAERSKDLRAQAVSGRRAQQIRRSRQAGQPWPRRPILRIPLHIIRAA